MLVRFARLLSLALIAAFPAAGVSAQDHQVAKSPNVQAPAAVPGGTTLVGGAFGGTVALTWTPAPGATSYVIGVGVQPNVYVLVQDVGNTNAFIVTAPPGTFFIRVAGINASGLGTPSNEVPITVAPAVGLPPAGPGNLHADVGGDTASLTWQLGQGGGPATALVFAIGSTPGGFNLGLVPLNITTSASHTVAPGTYFTRLYAVGPGGVSHPSNEVVVTIAPAGCAAPAGPTVTANVSGTTVNLAWNAVAGAAGYRLDASTTPGGALIFSQVFNAATTGLSAPGIAPGTYYARVTAISACGTETTGPEVPVVVTAPPVGGGPRSPAGRPMSSLNYAGNVINDIARRFPNDLRNSCGNNTWLFRVASALRSIDSRWGLNWKRGVVGSLSQDAITYNHSTLPDEQASSPHIYGWDVIANHCPTSGVPSARFHDITDPNGQARWTIQPYVQAGFTP